jgi:hypothetical protein
LKTERSLTTAVRVSVTTYDELVSYLAVASAEAAFAALSALRINRTNMNERQKEEIYCYESGVHVGVIRHRTKLYS